jgi:hypothetical protein
MPLSLNQENPIEYSQLIFLMNELGYLAEPGYGNFNQDHPFGNFLL